MSSSAVPPIFLTDRADRSRLRLTGRDRQTFLQGMATNDVAALTTGTGCYAFMLDATGHVLADMRVLCLEESLLLDLEPGRASFVAETLEKYLIMEKCRIADVTAETAQIFVGGEKASLLISYAGVEVEDGWPEGRNRAEADGLMIAATRLIPGPGFDIYGPPDTVQAFTEKMREAAVQASMTPVDLTPVELDVLRVEAGVPRFGTDIDARVLAPETGQQERAISYKKGCYIGQEIVARIDARGHTNRNLAGFLLSGAPLPAPDTPVEADGREVGRITSAVHSPTLGRPIALGYLRNEFRAPGTVVTVAGNAATVAELPFVP
jgi:folate-binding protein YgfZ